MGAFRYDGELGKNCRSTFQAFDPIGGGIVDVGKSRWWRKPLMQALAALASMFPIKLSKPFDHVASGLVESAFGQVLQKGVEILGGGKGELVLGKDWGDAGRIESWRSMARKVQADSAIP